MANRSLARAIRIVRRQAGGPEPSDGQMLTRFIDHRDTTAIETLVRRHGPTVLSVCRRLLRHPQDAEDAFQATFLVLVRKAASIRPRNLVGPWLYGVARMTAVRARVTAAKRRVREEPLVDLPDNGARPDRDLAAVIDEEMARLPEKYRLPIVLCDIEGWSQREAAERLGWPQGTVSGRLFRGRQMLAKRLTRRGIVASAAAVLAVLGEGTATARVSEMLCELTVTTAAAGLIPGPVAALTEGVVKTMLLTKLKTAMTSLVVLTLCGLGALGVRTAAADPPEKEADRHVESRPSSVVRVSPTELRFAPTDQTAKLSAADLDRMQGLWVLVDGVDNGHPLVPGSLDNSCLVIRKDRYSHFVQDGTKLGQQYGGVGQVANGRLVLWADAVPKTLVWTMKWPSRGVQHGIYELDGDTLRVCSGGKPETIRPDDFACEKGSFKTVHVYKRSRETEQTKKQERLAVVRQRAATMLRELLEADEDEEAFPSPTEHEKWEREKLDEIGRVLAAMRQPVGH